MQVGWSNFACNVVHDGRAALESIKQRPPDVVITDYKLGDNIDGMEVLREAKRVNPATEVVVITAYGSEQLARQALSRESEFRAYDYLIKPIDIDELRSIVGRAAEQSLAARESRLLREQIDSSFEFSGIIGGSEVMRREFKRLKKIARSKSTVKKETGRGW